MAFDGISGVLELRFDLDGRELRVWHRCPSETMLERLEPLGFGAELVASVDDESYAPGDASDPKAEARVLWQLLAINGVMFVVELALGLLAESTGLIADSLDMFADASVYGLSLYAVGRGLAEKRRAARLSGFLQLALGLLTLFEVGRRALVGSEPVEGLMIGVALLALLANLLCVALLAKHRDGGVHLKASWIFTASDALANLGVIVAGALVAITGAAWPDLVVGTAVALLVIWSAVRILRLR